MAVESATADVEHPFAAETREVADPARPQILIDLDQRPGEHLPAELLMDGELRLGRVEHHDPFASRRSKADVVDENALQIQLRSVGRNSGSGLGMGRKRSCGLLREFHHARAVAGTRGLAERQHGPSLRCVIPGRHRSK